MSVNPAVVDAKVVRHSPDQWRANQGEISVSWKSDLFPSHGSEKLLVEVMTYRVGQNECMSVFSPFG